MPLHLYNGFARPVDYSLFAREWTRPHRERAGPRPAWLARDRRQDGQRDSQGENMPPACYATHSLWERKQPECELHLKRAVSGVAMQQQQQPQPQLDGCSAFIKCRSSSSETSGRLMLQVSRSHLHPSFHVGFPRYM